MDDTSGLSPRADAPISLLRSNLIGANEYVEVFMDEVSFADGRRGTHLRVREPGGGVVVVAVNEQGRFYLHNAYHYAVNDFCLEFVRGYGQTAESAEQAALREFAEEAAFQVELVGPPEPLGVLYPNGTILMNRVSVFLVPVRSGAATTPRGPDEGLRNGAWYSSDAVGESIAGGKIRDSFTLAAWSLFCSRTTGP